VLQLDPIPQIQNNGSAKVVTRICKVLKPDFIPQIQNNSRAKVVT